MLAFGFGNTVLPVVALLGLALAAPLLTVPPRVMTQSALARGMVLALGLVLLAGAALFCWLYARAGNDVAAMLAADPLGQVWFYLTRAALSGMFWGPVLAFVWYGRAIEVERRKGEARLQRREP